MNITQTSPRFESDDRLYVLRMVRCSGDGGDTGRQYDETDQTAAELGLRIRRTLELHGVSGTAVINDEEFLKLLEEMRDVNIHGLLLSAFDRYFRPKNFEQIRLVQQLMDIGKPIFTTREGEIDPTSDSGWELLMNLSTRAGAELRELRRRCVSGKMKNAKRGFRNSGSHPFGYRHSREERTDQRNKMRTSLVIYEPEAKIVRQIFEAIRQPRHFNLNHGEAIVQILAEALGGDPCA